MVALPAAIPVTTPEKLTEVVEGELLLQVPPALPEAVNVVDAPAQTEAAPEIEPAFGNGLTVMEEVATLVPQTLVTV